MSREPSASGPDASGVWREDEARPRARIRPASRPPGTWRALRTRVSEIDRRRVGSTLSRFRRPGPRLVMVLVGVLVVMVRLIYLWDPVRRDEAGYLLVARSWGASGPHLYGHYFVDRPPG